MITSRKDTDWKNFEALAPVLLGLTPAELLSQRVSKRVTQRSSLVLSFSRGGQFI
jgi:hypothetical protein